MNTTGSQRFVGLISGTSADGIDAAAVDFGADGLHIKAFATYAYPADLSAQLQPLLDSERDVDLHTLGLLDARVADAFAHAANAVIESAGWSADQITAIGSHGQTIFHAPDTQPPFSLQLGDPNRITALTGIQVVADFRRADLAAGGQAAPYAPLIHARLFRTDEANLAVVNIGGIANITWLPKDPSAPVLGFDSGPGNCLMNAWCRRHLQQPFDDQGRWAASGQAQPELLQALLQDAYLKAAPPKSTGREYFTLAWLNRLAPRLAKFQPADVQATLLQLTAHGIAAAIRQCGTAQRVIGCGGGVHNQALMHALGEALAPAPVTASSASGVDPDAVEALLFAWLAQQRLHQQRVDTGSITGASRPVLLGSIFAA